MMRTSTVPLIALLLGVGAIGAISLAEDRTHSTIGSAAVILLLLAAFVFLYRRSERARAAAQRLARVNDRLLVMSRRKALTDSLTGLGSRRSLIDDLGARLSRAVGNDRLVLALFDLDGFKQYNDTFGHPAGDSLLAMLSERLERSLGRDGSAYRMGGDEFCVISSAGAHDFDALIRRSAASLHEKNEVFEIACSYGVAYLPSEAAGVSEALRLADQRMYAQKSELASTSRQSADVLLQVLHERGADLDDHVAGVVALAELTARRLGLEEREVRQIALAAELHDVGKVAIPYAILHKPGPLDDDELAFIRRHTEIGERIVRAAPALSHTAALVRSCHERVDGTGYPDRLGGDAIPLGARIVAVCDAFDAMVSERPYAKSVPTADALAELRRCAGKQFDSTVVEAVCHLVVERDQPVLSVAAH